MLKIFMAIEKLITRITIALAATALAIAASLAVFQVLARFVLEQPAEWTEPLIRFSLIWMVALGLSASFRQGAMVSVDVLRQVASPRFKNLLSYLVSAITLILLVVLAWYGWDFAKRGRFQTMSGIESISMIWAYLAIPIGSICAIFGVIGNLADPINKELETAQ